MDARSIVFGVVEIDGIRYEHDVVVERGRVGKRRKKTPRPLRDRYGHTPLSLLEPIPWRCRQLIIGTGVDGALLIAEDVRVEAERRGVAIVARVAGPRDRPVSDRDGLVRHARSSIRAAPMRLG